ncbi:hypothetical protein [Chryseobacterium turcicum]|uniref:Uncharacterized protein n=1 Tax=Chryseobacterium turcicum TaxID=2898076 RepID=A0A9Q3V2G0_9FLAO|nr:hypothetical protein [Chryseobacterium turcicum]MCD1116912.1 hypothetical protein [Chryseobacterium turcicum]
MAHRITLIITKESINTAIDIPHFYENNYLVIPTDDDGWEAQMIEDICKTENSFDEIFNVFFKEFYKEDIGNGNFEDICNELTTFENLYILEIIEKLKISDFIIIHYSEVGFDIYQNYIGFKNKEYIGYSKFCTKFCETRLTTENYWRFESCRKRYSENLNK